jgi:hypothetical protein
VRPFIPSGYITVHDAPNHVGRELSPEWTGEEHKARAGLLSEDEWSKVKDLSPARGGDAPAGGPRLQVPKVQSEIATAPHGTRDPSDPSYNAQYQAHERYAAAFRELRARLEARLIEAAILDPWNGMLHRAPASLWRRHDADRMIARGEAPLLHSPNTGVLLLKRFADARVPAKPMPKTKIGRRKKFYMKVYELPIFFLHTIDLYPLGVGYLHACDRNVIQA